MHTGIVVGTVVATQKTKSLHGYPLKIVIPCDQHKAPIGPELIAVDSIGSREGDLVLWVSKREASLAIPEAMLSNLYPVDAAITGIIDAIS